MRHARICAVRENLVVIESDDVLTKNEVVYVQRRAVRLRGEILRVRGARADVQVFEDTRGIRVGDPVELSGEPLSVTLGPGLLGRLYDGLQQPLNAIAARHGFLLPEGVDFPALDTAHQWLLTPCVAAGDAVHAGQPLGTVQEGRIAHQIMAPFDLEGSARVISIAKGALRAGDPVAHLRASDGGEREVTMLQRWPVRMPLGDSLLQRRLVERLPPDRPLATGMRIIDALFPIALGGTACIPGPFGAGKTVLQNLIATYADVDVVVIIACGERASEVVETLTRLPELRDPRAGGSLLDRTVIICNTSAMPVVARESSIYVGVTIGEYYRQMGLDVLVIADSTSRWAQAMRETSGRMEEIPGDEAFPAYLDSTIHAVYERAGVIDAGAQGAGTLTMIGTVSPAGGNFEEPVTQSTLGTVKVFLALSAERAYRRAFPAIDPLQSWSRYIDPLAPWHRANCGPTWGETVTTVRRLLHQGDAIQQMLEVAGDEGVSLDEYWTFHQARLIDEVFLQQNSYDPVDVYTPIGRQRELLELLALIVATPRGSTDRAATRERFATLANLFRELNYAATGSADYARLREAIGTAAKVATPAGSRDPMLTRVGTPHG